MSLWFSRTHTHPCTHTLCHSFESLLTWILLPVALSPGSPDCPLLPDKLFGKRLLQARHYIMSRKSWLKMVPTENCDILMTFPGALMNSTFTQCLCHSWCQMLKLLIYCSGDRCGQYVGWGWAHCAGLFLRIANWKHEAHWLCLWTVINTG